MTQYYGPLTAQPACLPPGRSLPAGGVPVRRRWRRGCLPDEQLDGTPIHMDTSQMLVDTLVADGITDPFRVVIQSFGVANLIDLQTRIMPAAGMDAQLLQLLNGGGYDITFNFDPAKAALGADPGAYAALDYPVKADTVPNNDLYNPAGLKVIPCTIRDDEAFQALNPDGSVPAPTDEYRNLIAAGVDGFFTDFPGTGRQVVDQLKAEALPPQSRGELFGNVGRPSDVLGILNS